ncbi:tail protein X [Shewanella dokdonensis]|nr:tail protein X [Shewanella dokdonensis]
MGMTVYSQQGDTLDLLCQRHLGTTRRVTEKALQLNPHLADKGPVLPLGTAVLLPELSEAPAITSHIQLWD